jgi:hypothetical protein
LEGEKTLVPARGRLPSLDCDAQPITILEAHQSSVSDVHEERRWSSPPLLPLAPELRTMSLIAAYSMRHSGRACRTCPYLGFRRDCIEESTKRKILDESGMELVSVWLHCTGDHILRTRNQKTSMFCGRILRGTSCQSARSWYRSKLTLRRVFRDRLGWRTTVP